MTAQDVGSRPNGRRPVDAGATTPSRPDRRDARGRDHPRGALPLVDRVARGRATLARIVRVPLPGRQRRGQRVLRVVRLPGHRAAARPAGSATWCGGHWPTSSAAHCGSSSRCRCSSSPCCCSRGSTPPTPRPPRPAVARRRGDVHLQRVRPGPRPRRALRHRAALLPQHRRAVLRRGDGRHHLAGPLAPGAAGPGDRRPARDVLVAVAPLPRPGVVHGRPDHHLADGRPARRVRRRRGPPRSTRPPVAPPQRDRPGGAPPPSCLSGPSRAAPSSTSTPTSGS